MRCYDEPVEVRRGPEAPEQFLWRGRLWTVREVVAHWWETGAWWQGPEAASVLGTQDERAEAGGTAGSSGGVSTATTDLMRERECWRVEAAPGRLQGRGVFDLVFDWGQAGWRLAGCWD